jgi:plastocyanin
MKASLFGAALAALVATASAAHAATVTVTISDYTFAPATVTVHPGDKVVWSNQDDAPHTATARDGKSFDTGTIDPGASASVTFHAPGHYAYRCAIHPDMLGEVDVR